MDTLETAFQQLAPDVLRYITSIVKHEHQAEDLLQETFYKAYVALDTYDDDYSFRPWLFTIAKNTCMDYFRSHRRSLTNTPLAFDWNDVKDTMDLERDVVTNETLRDVYDLLNRLPPQPRQAFIFKVIYGLSYDDCQLILKRSPSALKSDVYRIRTMIKQRIER